MYTLTVTQTVSIHSFMVDVTSQWHCHEILTYPFFPQSFRDKSGTAWPSCIYIHVCPPNCFLASDSKPRLAELVTLKTRRGQSVNVIKSLAPQWKQFGLCLDFDHTGQQLDLIEAEHAHESHRVVACCQEMFRHWLEGNGVQPVTWRTLIKLLVDCNELFLVKQIKDALKLN